MNFKPGEREYLLEMRNLTTDVFGRDVFRGLDRTESDEYFALTRPDALDFQPGETHEEHHNRRVRYRDLHQKMELARVQAIGVEASVRTFPPTIN